MAVVISYALQKGGVGKTSTTCITGWLLSRLKKKGRGAKKNNRVLICDMDSQGNATSLLSGVSCYSFIGKSIYEALLERNAEPYIVQITETLHLLPGNDDLAGLARYLYTEYRGNPGTLLKETLSPLLDQYDYILIDCPPNLGEQTVNAMTASDFAVVVMQSEPFAQDALDRYMEFLELVNQRSNPDLRVAGILTAMSDKTAGIDAAILEKVRDDYGSLVFNTVIHRRARIKEFSLLGITDATKSDKLALAMYEAYLKELISRVG